MRPLRLEARGFTAFREPIELDFTGLDVFAVSGPTGSGKSSLLDAMTYALYGRVERVGDRVGQLISQGRPRMAVTLEFEVGSERYRVTRSTPAKGATKILLERRDPDGTWRQAGEGADRVREAEPMIARAIGLTYDGFTRSVLLPQGKFSEFLVGDARKRRDILTELLGLSLFRRMAERAGAIAKGAADEARWTADMLEREYADATPEALREARRAARDAGRRERALGEAAARMIEILGRWQESRRSVQELLACSAEVERAAQRARDAAGELAGLAGTLREASAAVEARTAEVQAATAALSAAREAAEEGAAMARTMAEARLRAHALAGALQGLEGAALRRDAAREGAQEVEERLAVAERGLASLREALELAEEEAAAAEGALEEARHADLVAAVSAGLGPGDPCPVCGHRLERASARIAGDATAPAQEARAQGRRAVAAAREALARAERAAATARRDAEANRTERSRLDTEVEGLEATVAAERTALAAVLGDPLPDDPAAAVEARLEEAERLDRAERDAARAVAEAEAALLRAEGDRDRVGARIERQRDRLVAAGPHALLERAALAAPEVAATAGVGVPPDRGLDDPDPEALGRHAAALAGTLETLAEGLADEVRRRSGAEASLLAEATEHLDGLVEPAPTLEATAERVNAACLAAATAAGTAAQRAEMLAGRLERRRELAEEAARLEARATVFKALAQELRADRLIAFLQAEALQVLAAAGSERLSELSGGRYRLACRNDEFFVVDTWNGDEERSVRTLSGGETFLASLALALALAEQVRSLAVTDRARLDSLFLDEGFGTLDPETLRTVVDAIEQLGGDGRLVGVITHVPEIAEQFPRVEVRKSPGGSHLALVS